MWVVCGCICVHVYMGGRICVRAGFFVCVCVCVCVCILYIYIYIYITGVGSGGARGACAPPHFFDWGGNGMFVPPHF